MSTGYLVFIYNKTFYTFEQPYDGCIDVLGKDIIYDLTKVDLNKVKILLDNLKKGNCNEEYDSEGIIMETLIDFPTELFYFKISDDLPALEYNSNKYTINLDLEKFSVEYSVGSVQIQKSFPFNTFCSVCWYSACKELERRKMSLDKSF